MKKIIVFFLLTAILCLGGCSRGDSGDAAADDPSPTEDITLAVAASDTNTAVAAQNHIPPASATDLSFDETAYDQALDYVGRTLQDLYAVIGQPIEMPIYSPSEIQEGAQDGKLTYQGFFVRTLRTDTGEIVQEIYTDG